MKEITNDTRGIKKNLREYYEQSYANESDNLEEINNFLETYCPPKLNKEETPY